MESQEISIAVVGMSGGGLSSTGNTLLGRNVFRTGASLVPVTTESQSETTAYGGHHLTVTDSVAVHETRSDKTIKESLLSLLPVHIFILVFKIERVTRFHTHLFRTLENVYGSKVYQHMIVLFTFHDTIHDIPFAKFLAQTSPDFNIQTLLRNVSNRYLPISNIGSGEEKEEERRKTLDTIIQLAHRNDMRLFKGTSLCQQILECLYNSSVFCCTWLAFSVTAVCMFFSYPLRRLCNKEAKVFPSCPERKKK